jgi:hypothetical protein
MLYGIAQKEQLGFDKAVEVRLTPPQPLHLLPCHYHECHSPPSDSLPWQECKYRMSRYGVTCAVATKRPEPTLLPHATLEG